MLALLTIPANRRVSVDALMDAASGDPSPLDATTSAEATPEPRSGSGQRSVLVLHPNLLGIPFGLAGLAICWSIAGPVLGLPRWPAAGLWALTAAVWLVATIAYAGHVLRRRRFLAELRDPTFGAFTALPGILAMLLGGSLMPYSRPVAVTVFALGLVTTVAVGGYLSGQWIVSDLTLAQWHPGYFIPTVAGGLVAATVSAALGFPRLAQLMFGYGVACWLVLG